MRLLKRLPNGNLDLISFDNDNVPPYAILSHTWGDDSKEVTFEDMIKRVGQEKAGYEKIKFCGEQAARDGLQYFWVDSCCINKEIYSELRTAISSMFRWYERSTRCYVYLSDVSDENCATWEEALRKSRWFTRGWTLQELLAPTSVEFFSKDRRRLGDKESLEQEIHEITGIHKEALRGKSLFQFDDKVRMQWKESRQTKLEEDIAYSLLGIFGVDMDPRYGEGKSAALKRLEEEMDKLKRCCQDLRLIDPADHKKDIEHRKGDLLRDSYQWILRHPDFQTWRNNERSHLLWIKGDPGKGKTMLLCGIIDELRELMDKTALLSFYFCVATDSRINSATAVLRGLIYMLVCQQPSLVSHIRKKYDYAGKALFDDSNAWFALSDIFINILQDQNLNSTYLIIDALDECAPADLPKLLDFITTKSFISSRVKWIVSSRNWPDIERRLNKSTQRVKLSLELNEDTVSAAVESYITFKVSQLAEQNGYSSNTREAVEQHLFSNADGTFLWVSLACKELADTPEWQLEMGELYEMAPRGLESLYGRMLDEVCSSKQAGLLKDILGVVLAVRRPITLDELTSLVAKLARSSCNHEVLEDIIGHRGSFVTLRGRTISVVHQSAKEFLVEKAYHEIYPSKIEDVHHTIFSQSLQVMSKKLSRDMYGLNCLGFPIDDVEEPDPDPLSPIRYSCVYWIHHLLDSDRINSTNGSQDCASIDHFLRHYYLYWLEALSLCRSMSEGVVSMGKLEALLQARMSATELLELVRDARRFIMSHKQPIQISPLQAYASALIFSPASSLIRRVFQEEEPKWITIKPGVGDKWSPCLQTLYGHSGSVNSIAFSHDSTQLASASDDHTVKIWVANSGDCLQTLEGHSKKVYSVAFSHDSTRLASASRDHTVKIWDANSGTSLQTLKGHSNSVKSVAFSHDSTRLASASGDHTVKIWDTNSGDSLQTLKGHSNSVKSVAFSHDSTQLASASDNDTIKIWVTNSSNCLQTLKGHSNSVYSVAFSHDSTRLASASGDHTVKIWDTNSGDSLQTLKGHSNSVKSVAFSHDSTRLASASDDYTIKIWDTNSSNCLQTLRGHSNSIFSVAFSYNSTRLASASRDATVKIWDTNNGNCLQTLKGHSWSVKSVAFSYDSTRLASASTDDTVKIWDISNSDCLQTLEGHSEWVNSTALSHDSTQLASASDDHTIKIWDTSSGDCLQTLEGHSDVVKSVALSYDSAQLVSASWDTTVKIWDASSGDCLQTLEGHSSFVNSAAFSHDLTRLVSASWDHTVKIWDANSGDCLQTLKGHNSIVYSAAFSHDSTQLASASGDHTVRIWDARNGHCLQTLEGHSYFVKSVAFSPDLTRLASASYYGVVKIWDTSSGDCLQTLDFGRTLYLIAFDTVDSNLRIDMGTVALDTLSTSHTLSNKQKSQIPRYQDVGLSLDERWITLNSKKLIWLPTEYRLSCLAVSGSTIGAGVRSGNVWMFRLQSTEFEHQANGRPPRSPS